MERTKYRLTIIRPQMISMLFMIINITYYFSLVKTGDVKDSDFMIRSGALYVSGIVENREYYRFLISTIMHFSLFHLVVNMISLYCVGNYVESHLGHGKFLVLYLCTSIGSSIFSFFDIYADGEKIIVAGASGAIYGIVGALIWIVLCHRGHFESISITELIGLTAIVFWYGYVSGGVNSAIHISGLVIGFLIAILIYRRDRDYDVREWLES
ncbi:MAG: rhomboid family intramembrane serine protease [Lachnospiraceae bacterium]|nr:rhomboid family intramembrane serine protease [Lachnospiraceae bacterium]